MKNILKKYLSAFIAILPIVFLIGIPTSAATTVEDLLQSKGYITYDPDADGVPEMAFYSDDLKNIGKGVDALNNNIAILTDKYDELATASEQYRGELISGLNSNVYAKANIPTEASYKDIISKINNIPAPTTALGKYYKDGDNTGLGVGISNSLQNIDVGIGGINSLKLGINESITLPSGYYPENMTIHNNVLNRGSLNWNPTGNTSMDIPSGYYSGGKISTSNAYNAGSTNGYNQGRNDGYNQGRNDGYNQGHSDGQASKSGSFRFRTSYSGNNRVDCTIWVNGQEYTHLHDSDGKVDYTWTW